MENDINEKNKENEKERNNDDSNKNNMGETGILDGTEERVRVQSVVTTATEKGKSDEMISSVSNVSSKMSCNRKSWATKNLPNDDINKKPLLKRICSKQRSGLPIWKRLCHT